MRIGRILAISVVTIASLIVIAALTVAVRLFSPSRVEQNAAPLEGVMYFAPW